MTPKISETPVAQKLLTIISNKLHIKRDALTPEKTWRELNVTEAEKEDALLYVAAQFGIPAGYNSMIGLNNGNGQITKDLWQNQIKNIKTIWNVLNFVESNDDFNGKPAAYNLK